MIAALAIARDQIHRSSNLLQAVLCFILGTISGGGLAPWHNVVLLVPSFVGFVWVIQSVKKLSVSWLLGWCFGFGHFLVGFYWIGNAFLVDVERYGWIAPYAVLILAAFMGIFPSIAVSATYIVINRLGSSTAGVAFVFAVIWTSTELLRGTIFTGLPWNLIGTVWGEVVEIMQFAAFCGVYGLGLLTLIICSLPATLADKSHTLQSGLWVGVAVMGFLLLWSIGTFRLSGAVNTVVHGVNLRLVQANIAQNMKWKPEFKNEHVRFQAELSLLPTTNGIPVTHIIWPETAIPFNLSKDKNLKLFIASLVPRSGLLITGAPRASTLGVSTQSFWNSLHALRNDGEIIATYDKIHLVPFGEYIPFRNILGFSKLTEGRVDFSRGSGERIWRLPNLPPLAPLICYEAIFPEEVVGLGSEPSWILNVTNDAWFGLSAGPYQHFAAVRFRAIELGVPLIRVANSGITAVIDAYGRVIKKLDLGKSGVIDSPLPHRAFEVPFYGKFGNRVTLFMLFAFGVFAIFLKKKKLH